MSNFGDRIAMWGSATATAAHDAYDKPVSGTASQDLGVPPPRGEEDQRANTAEDGPMDAPAYDNPATSGDVTSARSMWKDVSYDVDASELNRTVVADDEKKADFSSLLGAWGEQAKTIPLPSGEILRLDSDGNPIPSPQSHSHDHLLDSQLDVNESGAHDPLSRSDQMFPDVSSSQGDFDDLVRPATAQDLHDGDDQVLYEGERNELDDTAVDFDTNVESDHLVQDSDDDHDNDHASDHDNVHYYGNNQAQSNSLMSSSMNESRGVDPDEIEADVVLRDDEVVEEDSDMGSGLLDPRDLGGFSNSRRTHKEYEEESEGQQTESFGNTSFVVSDPPSSTRPLNEGFATQHPIRQDFNTGQQLHPQEDFTSVVLKRASAVETPKQEDDIPEFAKVTLKPSGRQVDTVPNTPTERPVQPLQKAPSVGFKEPPTRSSPPSAISAVQPAPTPTESRRKKQSSRTNSSSNTPETSERRKSRISGFLSLFGKNRSSRSNSGNMSRKSPAKTPSTTRSAASGSATASGALSARSGVLSTRSGALAASSSAGLSVGLAEGALGGSSDVDSSVDGTSAYINSAPISGSDQAEVPRGEEILVISEERQLHAEGSTSTRSSEDDEQHEPDLEDSADSEQAEEALVRLRTGEAHVIGRNSVGVPIEYQRLKSVAISIPGDDQITKSAKGPAGLSVYLLGKMARVTQRGPDNKFFSKTIKEHQDTIVDAMWFPEMSQDHQLSALATTDKGGLAMVHFFWTSLENDEPTELRHLRTIHIRFPKASAGSYYTKLRTLGSPAQGKIAFVPDEGVYVRVVDISAQEEFNAELEATVPMEVPAPSFSGPIAVFDSTKAAASAPNGALLTAAPELSVPSGNISDLAPDAELDRSVYLEEEGMDEENLVVEQDNPSNIGARSLSGLGAEADAVDDLAPSLSLHAESATERADYIGGEIIEGAEIVEEEIVSDGLYTAPMTYVPSAVDDGIPPTSTGRTAVEPSIWKEDREQDFSAVTRSAQEVAAKSEAPSTGGRAPLAAAVTPRVVEQSSPYDVSSHQVGDTAPAMEAHSGASRFSNVPGGEMSPGIPSGLDTPDLMSSGIATPVVPPPAPALDSGFATPSEIESGPSSVVNEVIEPSPGIQNTGSMPDRPVGGFGMITSAGSLATPGSMTPGTPAPPVAYPAMNESVTPGLSQYSAYGTGDDTPISGVSGASTPSLAPEAPALPVFPGSGEVSGTDTPLSGVYSGASTPRSDIPPPAPTLPSLSVGGSGADTPVSYSGASTPGIPDAPPEFPTMSGSYTPLSDSGSGSETPGLIPGTPPALPSLPGSGDMTPYITGGSDVSSGPYNEEVIPSVPSFPRVDTQGSAYSEPSSGLDTPETPLNAPSLPSMPVSGEATPGSVTSVGSFGAFPEHGAPPSLPSGPVSRGSSEASAPVFAPYADRAAKLPGANSGIASTVDTPALGTPAAAMTPPQFETSQRYDSAESVTLPSPPKLPSFSDMNRMPPPPAPELPSMPEPEGGQ